MPMPTRMRQLFAKGFVVFTLLVGFVTAHALDLKNAVIVTPPNLFGSEKKAVQMLIEEVAKRTELHLPTMTVWPASNAPVIAVGNRSLLKEFAGPYSKELLAVRKVIGPEGYRLCVKRGAASSGVFVIGDDARSLFRFPLLRRAAASFNHAQRTRPSRPGCNRTPSWAGSLSLGRSAQFSSVGGRVGTGVNRFAPDLAPLRCALPGRRFGLAWDTVVGRLLA